MSNESEAEETEQDVSEETAGEDVAHEVDADADTDAESDASESASESESESESASASESESASASESASVSESGDAETEGLQNGEFVRLGYTARTVDGGQLVDTTDREVAEEEGVADEGEFEPRVIALGEEHIFPAVEDDLIGKSVGDEDTVVVSAEQAFGEYDDDQVRTVSADKIDEDDRYPGAHVQIDGEQGMIETIIGGRARVDFNHPLAGEDIEYDYEVLERVDDRVEQAEGILGVFLDMDLNVWFETDVEEEEQLVEPDEDVEAGDDADEEDEGEARVDDADGDEDDEGKPDLEPEYETVEVEKETLYIESTPQLAMDQQWMFRKSEIADQLVDLLGVDRVIVQEILGEGGMGGMMGGMGGMMGGMGGGEGELEEALEDADVDADELMDEIDEAADE